MILHECLSLGSSRESMVLAPDNHRPPDTNASSTCTGKLWAGVPSLFLSNIYTTSPSVRRRISFDSPTANAITSVSRLGRSVVWRRRLGSFLVDPLTPISNPRAVRPTSLLAFNCATARLYIGLVCALVFVFTFEENGV